VVSSKGLEVHVIVCLRDVVFVTDETAFFSLESIHWEIDGYYIYIYKENKKNFLFKISTFCHFMSKFPLFELTKPVLINKKGKTCLEVFFGKKHEKGVERERKKKEKSE